MKSRDMKWFSMKIELLKNRKGRTEFLVLIEYPVSGANGSSGSSEQIPGPGPASWKHRLDRFPQARCDSFGFQAPSSSDKHPNMWMLH